MAAAVALTAPAYAVLNAPSAPARALDLTVLSNRADLISGGDALVAVDLPSGVRASSVRVKLGGKDITDRFGIRINKRYEGLVVGLMNGPNELVASAPGAQSATITITNHPIGGPVFAGPQIQPWVCQATAVDKQCNEPTKYDYLYMPAGVGALSFSAAGQANVNLFRPYDPQNPPSAGAIASTTNDQGNTVPFIVRIETGYLDRDQYSIAALYDPTLLWAPWSPQKGWNHKLVITHGASCGVDHGVGTAPDVKWASVLAKGFILMSTAADNAGHNCNVVTEAESLMMAKERVVEAYGEIRYTIGSGCSGGSLAQQQVANAYPGIYDGILPQCSFPDAWTTGQQLEDYVLTRRYFENPTLWGSGTVWTPTQIAAVEGHPDHLNAIELSTLYGPLPDPQAKCNGVTDAQRWSPQKPKGVRCSLQDYMVNVFGRRASDGYAGRAYDNVGVEYGLEALKAGTITPAQFVDLNVAIGSHDINYVWQQGRVTADREALRRAYESGAFNVTNNLDQVAIIDLRGPDPGAFHDAYRAFAVRARLDREQGHHDNQVIWQGFAPIIGDAFSAENGLFAMDRWLAAVEKDTRNLTKAQKIVADKPKDIHDQCTNGTGVVIPGEAGELACQAIVQVYSTPRVVAGEPLTTDTSKCQTKQQIRSAYLPIQFTDAQWKRLRTAYPYGVCDYTKVGAQSTKTVPWQTYENGPGTGRALPPAPQ